MRPSPTMRSPFGVSMVQLASACVRSGRQWMIWSATCWFECGPRSRLNPKIGSMVISSALMVVYMRVIQSARSMSSCVARMGASTFSSMLSKKTSRSKPGISSSRQS